MLSSSDGCMCSDTMWKVKLPGYSAVVASTGTIAVWLTPNPLTFFESCYHKVSFPTCFVDKWMGVNTKWLEYWFTSKQAYRCQMPLTLAPFDCSSHPHVGVPVTTKFLWTIELSLAEATLENFAGSGFWLWTLLLIHDAVFSCRD